MSDGYGSRKKDKKKAFIGPLSTSVRKMFASCVEKLKLCPQCSNVASFTAHTNPLVICRLHAFVK